MERGRLARIINKLNARHARFLVWMKRRLRYFDIVYAAQVFEHLTEPQEDLKEISRTLRSGGILYADVPNYRTLSILAGRDQFTSNAPPQHINYFTPVCLASFVRKRRFIHTSAME